MISKKSLEDKTLKGSKHGRATSLPTVWKLKKPSSSFHQHVKALSCVHKSKMFFSAGTEDWTPSSFVPTVVRRVPSPTWSLPSWQLITSPMDSTWRRCSSKFPLWFDVQGLWYWNQNRLKWNNHNHHLHYFTTNSYLKVALFHYSCVPAVTTNTIHFLSTLLVEILTSFACN